MEEISTGPNLSASHWILYRRFFASAGFTLNLTVMNKHTKKNKQRSYFLKIDLKTQMFLFSNEIHNTIPESCVRTLN